MSFDSEQLIDRIYEAAVIPEFWPGVLDALAPLAECDGGFVFIVDAHQNVRIASSERFVPLTSAFVNEGWVPRNIRAPRVAAMNYAGFVVDLDIVSVTDRVKAGDKSIDIAASTTNDTSLAHGITASISARKRCRRVGLVVRSNPVCPRLRCFMIGSFRHVADAPNCERRRDGCAEFP